MLRLTVAQFSTLQTTSEKMFVERLSGHLQKLGQEPGAASEIAQSAYVSGKARGLRSVEEFEAFAEVIMDSGLDLEPAWSREIVDDGRPMKASRLRVCQGATRRGKS